MFLPPWELPDAVGILAAADARVLDAGTTAAGGFRVVVFDATRSSVTVRPPVTICFFDAGPAIPGGKGDSGQRVVLPYLRSSWRAEARYPGGESSRSRPCWRRSRYLVGAGRKAHDFAGDAERMIEPGSWEYCRAGRKRAV